MARPKNSESIVSEKAVALAKAKAAKLTADKALSEATLAAEKARTKLGEAQVAFEAAIRPPAENTKAGTDPHPIVTMERVDSYGNVVETRQWEANFGDKLQLQGGNWRVSTRPVSPDPYA